jgi:hypothetical protein
MGLVPNTSRGQANKIWTPDNLTKPTLDAMDGVLGARRGKYGRLQADDERVDHLEGAKRRVTEDEPPRAKPATAAPRCPLEAVNVKLHLTP